MLSNFHNDSSSSDFQELLNCPQFTMASRKFVEQASFWVEGTLSCAIALAGFFGNVGSSIVLSQKEMRNSFNLLLIALACFDNVYLFGSILESFRKDFNLQTNLHVILFPYVLYPLQSIAMTGSILMTVAIALERYMAVHYPLNYSQAVNDINALKQRIMKFLCPVFTLSFVLNITKFMEATYTYEPLYNDTDVTSDVIDAGSDVIVEVIPILRPTKLRVDPNYSILFNWFRFVTIGVIPFGLLVLFYALIYADIQNRRQQIGFRKKLGSKENSDSSRAKIIQLQPINNHHPTDNENEDGPKKKSSNSCPASPTMAGKAAMQLMEEHKQENGDGPNKDSGQERAEVEVANKTSSVNNNSAKSNTSSDPSVASSILVITNSATNLTYINEQEDSIVHTLMLAVTTRARSISQINIETTGHDGREVDEERLMHKEGGFVNSNGAKSVCFSSVKGDIKVGEGQEGNNLCSQPTIDGEDQLLQQPINDQGDRVSPCDLTLGMDFFSNTTLGLNMRRQQRSTSRKSKANANAKRRRMEDQLASIFMGYILVFLICHSPRLMLNIYELATIRVAVACQSANMQPFPAWSLVVMCTSHLLLVVNSSINILIYCILSTKFREESCRMARNLAHRLCNCCRTKCSRTR